MHTDERVRPGATAVLGEYWGRYGGRLGRAAGGAGGYIATSLAVNESWDWGTAGKICAGAAVLTFAATIFIAAA
jgi:hypothetical protein